jgi:alginate O-acetyltransferase complex protein AlgI
MLTSIVLDYTCGYCIVRLSGLSRDKGEWPFLTVDTPRSRGQKIALFASIAGNLGLLGLFKYFDFAAENINQLAMAMGLGQDWVPMLRVVLPVGISFYTFQTMSYSIDVYRGHARALKNPIDFACYVSMFPQLVAGPIIRYQTIADQIVHRTHTWDKFARGVALFCLGMAKKVLLANPMGHVADAVFEGGTSVWYDAWYGIFAYTFQLYFDFSAYSDMAIGLGLMLGFAFIKNFDSPYHSQSITEFWQRWHISLSSWLRDYLYVPIGGNRIGLSRTYINLIIVMVLGGLWHGAAWKFVLFGTLHGGMLAFERLQGRNTFYRFLPKAGRVAMTFVIVSMVFVIFRTDTVPEAVTYLQSMFGQTTVLLSDHALSTTVYTPYHLALFFLCIPIIWGAPQTWTFTQTLSPVKAAYCLSLFLISVMFMWTQTVNPFLYFQF